MKRSSTMTLLILSAFAACGQTGDGKPCNGVDLQSTPTLCPDRASIGFGLENRSGAYIGTRPQETLIITNGSTADLEISQITLSGDSNFAMDTSAPLPAKVAGNKTLLVRLIFSPDAEGLFQSNLNVKSNADKCAPNQRDGGYPADCGNVDIIIGGCGVDPNSDAGVPAECLP